MLQFEGQQDLFLFLDNAVEKLYSYPKKFRKECGNISNEYILLIDVVEHYGGTFYPHPTLLAMAKSSNRTEK